MNNGSKKINNEIKIAPQVDTNAQPPEEEKVQVNAEAKERVENGPWVLWSKASNQVKSAAMVATTKAENNRLAEILLKYGNNVRNWPPLIDALVSRDYESVLYLIEHGANVRDQIRISKHFYSALDIIFTNQGKLWVEKIFEKPNSNKLIHYESDSIPEEHHEMVRKLLFVMINKGALDPGNGYTCRSLLSVLVLIVKYKWYDIFESAIKTMRGQSYFDWKTLYSNFISSGNEQAIEILDRSLTKHTLAIYGFHLDDRLITAVKANNFPMVKYFPERGANVNCGNGKTNENPLAIAATKGNKDIIDLLIANGAKLG